jgi:phage shock protein C
VKKTFRLNRRDKKLMGVCAGISDMTGVDATIVRVAMVLITLAGAFPWTVIAYLLAGWLAKPADRLDWDAPTRARMSVREYQESLTDTDRRMDEIDQYVAGSTDNSLAREIERLR